MWTDPNDDPIRCLAHHSKRDLLAVGCGGTILLAHYNLHGESSVVGATWTDTWVLPSPPERFGFPEEEPLSRSVQFLRDKDLLLVSYLSHGIVLVVSIRFLASSPSVTFLQMLGYEIVKFPLANYPKMLSNVSYY